MGRRAKGRYLHSAGYILISNGKRAIYEHRKVAEDILGRPLMPEEITHHINGDKTDNRPENISITERGIHTRLHLTKRVHTSCGYCGSPLEVVPSKIRLSKSGMVFCTHSCFAKYYYSKGVRGRPFTETEDDLIRGLRSSSIGWREIGRRLGRNHESIRTRAKKLGGVP